jgi:hypothetical protein
MSGYRMPPDARRAVAQAWVEVLRARHPELVWNLTQDGQRRPLPAAQKASEKAAA